MKKLIILFALLFSLFAYADIIVTKSDGNIEDVTVVEITETEVIYTQKGTRKSIPYENVEAILYDDGRYVTLPSKSQTYSDSENNISVSTDSDSDSNHIPKNTDRKNFNENNGEKSDAYCTYNQTIKEAYRTYNQTIKEALNTLNQTIKEAKEAYKVKKSDPKTKDSSTSQPDSNNNW